MAGLSGAGIDQALYPNIYGPEQKMAGAYGRRAGAAAGPQQGSAAGPAVQNFRNVTAMDRMQGQQQQAQGYGQMLSQLAMLAAYMRQRQQPSMDAPGTDTMPGVGQQMQLIDPNFGFLGPQYRAPSPGYQSPRKPYHEPQY